MQNIIIGVILFALAGLLGVTYSGLVKTIDDLKASQTQLLVTKEVNNEYRVYSDARLKLLEGYVTERQRDELTTLRRLNEELTSQLRNAKAECLAK